LNYVSIFGVPKKHIKMNNAKNREGSFYASKVHLFLNGMNTVMIIW